MLLLLLLMFLLMQRPVGRALGRAQATVPGTLRPLRPLTAPGTLGPLKDLPPLRLLQLRRAWRPGTKGARFRSGTGMENACSLAVVGREPATLSARGRGRKQKERLRGIGFTCVWISSPTIGRTRVLRKAAWRRSAHFCAQQHENNGSRHNP